MTTKHGHTPKHSKPSRTYNSWSNMVRRCTQPYHHKYYLYGAKGITVCDEWLDFSNFLRDMGERPEGKTLDRINGEIGYSKENCRWATPKEQQRNIKTNLMLTYNGITKTIADWADEYKIGRETLKYRIRSGWDLTLALTHKATKANRYFRQQIKQPHPTGA